MKSRTRERSRQVAGGGYKTSPTAWYPSDYMPRYQRISDFIEKKRDSKGLLPASNLQYRSIKNTVARLSGVRPAGVLKFSAHAYRLSPYSNNQGFSFPSSHTAKDKGDSAYVREMIVRTNPFRPEFSVPIMIRELVDISSMFKLASGTIAQQVGGNYLNWRFGWQQFFNDLKTLEGLLAVVERRLNEFKSLTMRGGLRRKVQLDSYSTDVSTSEATIHSAPAQTACKGFYTESFKTEVYGTCRWFPVDGEILDIDLTALSTSRQRITSVLLGIDKITPADLWNMIPWTWLIDYLVDIGPWLEANFRSKQVVPEYICIHRTTECKGRATFTSKPYWAEIGGSATSTAKYFDRKVVSSAEAVPLRLNLFTKSQAAVIAALLLKMKK